MQFIKSAATISLLAAGLVLTPSLGTAMPLSPAAGGAGWVANSPPLPTIDIRNNGADVAAGIIGGLIVGGMIASQPHYYRPYGYYYPRYTYYPPYPSVGAAVAACARRFKSYDPYSMTYLGYDGLRHPCP
jgi:hypothetical protein